MKSILSPVSLHAQALLSAKGIEIKHSTLLQILAALLGYETYAALMKEEGDQSLDLHLVDADFLIMNLPLGETRASRLCDYPKEVVVECIEALERMLPASIFTSIESFYSKHGIEAVAAALDDRDLLAKQVGSAWSLKGKLMVTGNFTCDESVWTARETWTLKGEAFWESNGKRSTNEKKPIGLVVYRKAGRGGLITNTSDDRLVAAKKVEVAFDLYRPDVLVLSSDGSTTRPWLAFLAHKPSRMVLGKAIAIDGNIHQVLDRLVVEAIDDAREFRITSIEMDSSVESVKLSELLRNNNIVSRRSNRQSQGTVERLIYQIANILSLPDGEEDGLLPELTADEFKSHLQIQIARYNRSITHQERVRLIKSRDV
ncbi:hypothetical protein [Pseudomonas fluorescens]|uniref:hypothetical protein n=1 Tax=Pseudomonas fluorescens TaxID=294 RepID=UPI00058A6706|nr:hypothetical protein [Pseudomonas fluorescens]CEL29307.1 hypothetical protein SRM1_02658 [Pseudomonas fluorescens]